MDKNYGILNVSIDDLIKLAEIAGYNKKPCSPEDCYIKGNRNEIWMNQNRIYVKVWQPHIDIAQAFEVLEGLGNPFTIDRECQNDELWYEVDIYSMDSKWVIGKNDPYNDNSDNHKLPISICMAVLKPTRR